MAYVITSDLAIIDSAGSPANIWIAENSTDNGNNTGWNIKAGGIIFCDYLNIIDSAATPADTWYAQESIDSGNNTGWIFAAPTPTPAAILEYPINLRSFTEHRRF